MIASILKGRLCLPFRSVFACMEPPTDAEELNLCILYHAYPPQVGHAFLLVWIVQEEWHQHSKGSRHGVQKEYVLWLENAKCDVRMMCSVNGARMFTVQTKLVVNIPKKSINLPLVSYTSNYRGEPRDNCYELFSQKAAWNKRKQRRKFWGTLVLKVPTAIFWGCLC